jgi:hypothetical protein
MKLLPNNETAVDIAHVTVESEKQTAQLERMFCIRLPLDDLSTALIWYIRELTFSGLTDILFHCVQMVALLIKSVGYIQLCGVCCTTCIQLIETKLTA